MTSIYSLTRISLFEHKPYIIGGPRWVGATERCRYISLAHRGEIEQVLGIERVICYIDR